MELGSDIVTEARRWLGTDFHHQGRVRKSHHNAGGCAGGCDCIGLVVGVAGELGLCSKHDGRPIIQHDRSDYSRLPEGFGLADILEKHLAKISLKEIMPGDILLFRFYKHPQHVGIVSDYPAGGLGLIHCNANIGKVSEHVLGDTWRKRIVAAYRFCG